MATSAQSGNWNVGSTWVGGVVPLDTDTKIVAPGHTVTITSNVTSAAINVNQGTLVVGAKLTMTGDLTIGDNVAGALTFSPNAHIELGANNLLLNCAKTRSTCTIADGAKITGTGNIANGTAGAFPPYNKQDIELQHVSIQISGSIVISVGSSLGSQTARIDTDKMLIIGASSVSIGTTYTTRATPMLLRNAAYIDAGDVSFKIISTAGAASNSSFYGNVFSSSGSVKNVIMYGLQGVVAHDNVYDSYLSPAPAYDTYGGVEDSLFLLPTYAGAATNLFGVNEDSVPYLRDCYFWAGSLNAHAINIVGGTTAQVVEVVCVFDMVNSASDNVVTNKQGVWMHGSLAIGNQKGVSVAAGGAYGDITVEKNTFHGPGTEGVSALFFAHGQATGNFVVRSNQSTASSPYNLISVVENYAHTVNYSGYNNSYGTTVVYDPVNLTITAGTANDVTPAKDPLYVDNGRNFKTFYTYKTGFVWNEEDARSFWRRSTGYNPELKKFTSSSTTTVSELVDWVRAGYSPTEPALEHAGHDGGVVGAFPYFSTVVIIQPTLSTPVISTVSQDGAAFSCSVNKAGTLYYIASPLSTVDESTVRGGRVAVAPTGVIGGTVDGLTADTEYRIFAQFVDEDGLKTAVVSSDVFRTAAIPVVVGKQRRIKIAKWDFGSGYRDAAKRQPLWDWFAKTFDAVVSGTSYTPTAKRNGFLEIQYEGGCISCDLPDENLAMLRAWCDTKGYDVNKLLVHMNADYTPQCKAKYGYGWSGRDKFRAWLGSTEVTTALYDSTTTVVLNGTLLLAQDYPFDQINVDVVTAGIGGSYTIKYWNGTTWATQPKTDGTTNFTVDGQIAIVPQADWARSKQAGNYNRYFIQIIPTGYTTAPVIQSMKADSWNNTDGTARGWDSTSGTIVNSGELAYNATPPTGKSAKFPHQSIVCGYFYPNRLMFNSGYYVGEICVEGQYYYELWRQHLLANASINAILWDTAYVGISSYVVGVTGETSATQAVVVSHMDIDFSKYSTWDELNGRRYKYSCDAFKAEFPYVKIFGNLWACPAQYVEMGDGIELEYYNQYIPKGVYPRLVEVNDVLALSGVTSATEQRYRTYDGFLPENNPNGIIGFMMYLSHAADWTAAGGYWDRANRSPILQLAKHLISYNPANDKCYFLYQHQNSAIYSMTDEIMVWKYNTILSNNLSVDTTTATKTISGIDFSKLHDGFDSWVTAPRTIKIGNDILQVSVVNNTTLTTVSPITEPHSIGDTVRLMGCDRWVDKMDNPPAVEDVYAWSNYFPAMDVDFGVPDTAGYNGGVRDLNWKTYTEMGGPRYTEVWRRDFTNCIVLLRAGYQTVTDSYLQTYSSSIPLGGTYYPLKADGTVGAGITSISLRAAEAAILMKSNTGYVPPTVVKPVVTKPVVSGITNTTATVTTTCDTAGSTLYYLVSANATESVANIKAGSTLSVVNSGAQTINLTGQTPGTSRYVHVLAVSPTSVDSDVQVSDGFMFPVVMSKAAKITLRTGNVLSSSLIDVLAIWWDTTIPSITPTHSFMGQTDVNGNFTLNLDGITSLAVGSEGFLLLYRLDTLNHKNSLVFAGRVEVGTI